MLELTSKGFSTAMELKGYSELFMFYAPSFDFFDRLEVGLKRVQQALESQPGTSKFNMSFYPVWEEQGKPHVAAYMQCTFSGERFGIESLDLTYGGGYGTELFRQYLERPSLNDIPSQKALATKLKSLCGEIETNSITKKGIRR